MKKVKEEEQSNIWFGIAIIGLLLILGVIIYFMPKNETKKISLVSYKENIKNNDYFDSAWTGLKTLNAYSSVTFRNSTGKESFKKNIDSLIKKNNEFIWVTENEASDLVYEYAKNNPDIYFGILDYTYDVPLNNLIAINFDLTEASFMAGYLAARKSNSLHIGVIGNESNKSYAESFKNGAKSAEKDVIVNTSIVSDENFKNEFKKLLIENDIIYVCSDINVIDLVKGSNYIININSNQTDKSHVMASITKNIKDIIANISHKFINGEVIDNKNELYDLSSGIVDIKYNNKVLLNEDIAKIEKIKENFIHKETN